MGAVSWNTKLTLAFSARILDRDDLTGTGLSVNSDIKWIPLSGTGKDKSQKQKKRQEL